MATLTWRPPEPEHSEILLTRTWRILPYDHTIPQGSRLYLALDPEDLAAGYEVIFPRLDAGRIPHRHVRSADDLRAVHAHPVWGGKAVVMDLPVNLGPEVVAAELDSLLAGKGLSGPDRLEGARPFGGRSGLLFLRRQGGPGGADDRMHRLAKLLGE